ncbi:expressed protein [Dictyostelium purpureum]|uniref:Expressed protein n=1 Tax=Dictyostelium purpureum TaxID=5786 RepID=F0ZGF9_DICPU|nr:uncharacterized protein DICPUDRAFT_94183 [Dictyostelium purpureum]EGC37006.1 expressed protein [Dictyostelium purpureum]|eukprot:XP_003286503.1 expressed protein [Dictyostelium purpureum]
MDKEIPSLKEVLELSFPGFDYILKARAKYYENIRKDNLYSNFDYSLQMIHSNNIICNNDVISLFLSLFP